jgi:predicted RNase H-like HicB family nuclease
MASTYQVELERDERGWWAASVPAVPGAHTQGRSIAQAMNRIREALSL